ncbi:MAG: ATP phosphoribosyltransferase regulatory subunit, partial [Bacteroidales bacterium]|nr:ATP phosphoribosyltransferase regulatory subunit [Bacteroidales bacterium]
MAQTTSIPKGTRDFSPLQMRRRQYIFDTIRKVFALHAYLPIETPAMEGLDTLLGKYGEEGDKLLFKILNSGDFWAKAAGTPWDGVPAAERTVKLGNRISEKGLRYDLTVPFARYVVQHRNDLTLPFKRYQMQPVWRADRPQRGRYREFYQCDADVVGSTSLWQEAELAQMVAEVFAALRIPVLLKINNRKILAGLAACIGCADKLT